MNTAAGAVLDHLGRHGVHAEAAEAVSANTVVSATLLEHARQLRADLLVTGAYAHSRVREFILGGTAQDVPERATIPVLLSR